MNPDTSITSDIGEDDQALAQTPHEIVVIAQSEKIDIDTGEVLGGSTVAAINQ